MPELKKGKKAALVVLLFVTVAIGLFLVPASRERRIKTALHEMEYWQRVLFNQTTPKDALRLKSWIRVGQRKKSPSALFEEAVQELVSLGYFTNAVFQLHREITNSVDYSAFNHLVTNSTFNDAHWSYSIRSNWLHATIYAGDLAQWSNLVSKWNSNRARSNLPVRNFEPEVNETAWNEEAADGP